MAETTESLSHTRWDCKYHIVFIPKCRRAPLYRELRKHLGEMFRHLAEQKESRIEEGHLLTDRHQRQRRSYTHLPRVCLGNRNHPHRANIPGFAELDKLDESHHYSDQYRFEYR